MIVHNKYRGSCPRGQSLLRYKTDCLWYHYSGSDKFWSGVLHHTLPPGLSIHVNIPKIFYKNYLYTVISHKRLISLKYWVNILALAYSLPPGGIRSNKGQFLVVAPTLVAPHSHPKYEYVLIESGTVLVQCVCQQTQVIDSKQDLTSQFFGPPQCRLAKWLHCWTCRVPLTTDTSS